MLASVMAPCLKDNDILVVDGREVGKDWLSAVNVKRGVWRYFHSRDWMVRFVSTLDLIR